MLPPCWLLLLLNVLSLSLSFLAFFLSFFFFFSSCGNHEAKSIIKYLSMLPPCCSAVACICLYFAYILYTLAYSSLYYLYNRAAAGEEQEEKEKEDFVFVFSLCLFLPLSLSFPLYFPFFFYFLLYFLFLFWLFLFLIHLCCFSPFFSSFSFSFFSSAASLLCPCCLLAACGNHEAKSTIDYLSLLPLCWLLAACGNHELKSIRRISHIKSSLWEFDV